jgi:hypothetical protein
MILSVLNQKLCFKNYFFGKQKGTYPLTHSFRFETEQELTINRNAGTAVELPSRQFHLALKEHGTIDYADTNLLSAWLFVRRKTFVESHCPKLLRM